MSRDEWQARANAVCLANDERIIRIAQRIARGAGEGEEATSEPGVAEISRFADAALLEFRRMLDGLAALTPPAAERKAYERLVDHGHDAAERVEDHDADDQVALARELGDAFVTFNRTALRMGLSDCGEAEEEPAASG